MTRFNLSAFWSFLLVRKYISDGMTAPLRMLSPTTMGMFMSVSKLQPVVGLVKSFPHSLLVAINRN